MYSFFLLKREFLREKSLARNGKQKNPSISTSWKMTEEGEAGGLERNGVIRSFYDDFSSSSLEKAKQSRGKKALFLIFLLYFHFILFYFFFFFFLPQFSINFGTFHSMYPYTNTYQTNILHPKIYTDI